MGRSQQVNSPRQTAYKSTRVALVSNPNRSGFINPEAKPETPVVDKSHKRKKDVPTKRVQTERIDSPGIGDIIRMRKTLKPFKYSIPRAAFQKLVKETMNGLGYEDFRISRMALEALQEVSEEKIMNDFERLNILAQHGNRVTVKPIDYETLRRLESLASNH